MKYLEESSDEDDVEPKPDFWELTENHNPGNPRECRRILRDGGEVRPPKQYLTKEYIQQHGLHNLPMRVWVKGKE